MEITLPPIERAVRFGGFVLAHAALIAADLAEGELICPFAIVTKGDRRQVVPFEAETQAEAVEKGKASLDELRNEIDFWGFGREGLWSYAENPEEKTDVLVVSTWTQGVAEPVDLVQRFRPAATGNFVLLGRVEIIIDGNILASEEAAPFRALISEGISTHPAEVPWARWLVH